MRWLGTVGARSWVIAQREGAAVLVWLDGARPRELGLGLAAAALGPYAIVDTELWIAIRAGDRYELARIELADAAPQLQRGVGTFDGTRTGGVTAMAIGLSRVLVASTYPAIQLQLFDRASGKPIGDTVRVESDELEAPALRCTGDDCFAVGAQGHGRDRRLFVERFDARGAHEHKVLADDHAGNMKVVTRGDRTTVLWLSHRRSGLFARTLDRRGVPGAAAANVAGAGEPMKFEVVTGPRPHVAVQWRDRSWRVGMLEAGKLAEPVELGMDTAYWMNGALASDGLLVTGFTTTVEYVDGYHAWWAQASAAFIPTRSDPEAPLEVQPRTGGDGRGGLGAFPLVAPGAAAILLAPSGPEATDGGTLVVLRGPCP